MCSFSRVPLVSLCITVCSHNYVALHVRFNERAVSIFHAMCSTILLYLWNLSDTSSVTQLQTTVSLLAANPKLYGFWKKENANMNKEIRFQLVICCFAAGFGVSIVYWIIRVNYRTLWMILLQAHNMLHA